MLVLRSTVTTKLLSTGGASNGAIESDPSRRPTDARWAEDQEVAFADGYPALIVSQVHSSAYTTLNQHCSFSGAKLSLHGTQQALTVSQAHNFVCIMLSQIICTS